MYYTTSSGKLALHGFSSRGALGRDALILNSYSLPLQDVSLAICVLFHENVFRHSVQGARVVRGQTPIEGHWEFGAFEKSPFGCGIFPF